MANSVWKLNLIRDGKITQHPLFGGSASKNEVVLFGIDLLPGDEFYLSSPDSNKGYSTLKDAEVGTEKTEDNHIRITESGNYDIILAHEGVGKDVIKILKPTEESIKEKELQIENQKKIKNYYNREKVFVILHNIGIFLLAFIWVLPIIWLIIVSFSTATAPTMNTLPWQMSYWFGNYVQLFTEYSTISMFPTWFMNTLIVSICSCIVCTLFSVITAFCFSRMRWKGRKSLMNVSMILGLFPGVLTMICTYMLFQHVLQVEGNIRLIIAYSATSALGYLVAKGFFDTIPMSIDEAARIDGANKLQTFTRIILPLSKPTIVYTIITSFMSPWVDFMYAKIILQSGDTSSYTVAIGLYSMLDKNNSNYYYGVFCAGSVIIALPLTILFLFVQKYYVAGVTGGAVKG